MHSHRGALIIAVILLAVSCDEDESVEALDEVPRTVSYDFRQVAVSPSGRIEVEAEKVEIYDRQKSTNFFKVNIKESDETGQVRLEGSVDSLHLLSNGNAAAKGSVMMRNWEDDSEIRADQLDWFEDERRLEGTGMVFIDTGDGLTAQGEGFQGDMARKTYSFDLGITGSIVVDDD